MNAKNATMTYFILIGILAILSAVAVFLPTGIPVELAELPGPKALMAGINFGTMVVVYGGLGFLGLILSRKLAFADIWEKEVTHRQRFVTPLLVGIGIGLFFILADQIFIRFHSFGQLPHPPFPTSIVASITAGIGEEVIFRLFFISFWVWLISRIILKNRWQNQLFWIVSIISAIIFAVGHMPSAMAILGISSVSEIPTVLIVEMILLNGVLSLFAAGYMKKYGFLAAVGIHFWTDIIWHVLYGLI